MNPELLDWIWKAAIGFVVALIWYVLKDRKKQKLEEVLAEETQQPKIKKVGIEALESQILAMSKAWEEERESKNRVIAELREALAEASGKLATAEETIADLKDRAERMQTEITRFKERLEELNSKFAPKEAF